MSGFVYIVCQTGAEATIKSQVSQAGAEDFRFAFSRPGFLTFKTKLPRTPWNRDLPRSPFVRTSGNVLGTVEGDVAEKMIDQIVDMVRDLKWDATHVWQRDQGMPGSRGFEPGPTALSEQIGDLLHRRFAAEGFVQKRPVGQLAKLGDRVLDVIIVEPNKWWIGGHLAEEVTGCWPGGVFPMKIPEEMISRAYLKIGEAIAWSGFPFEPGDEIVEIGSSPGGACQRLLELGLKVTGVDPAEMDPTVEDHPNFRFIRARSLDVRRREFSRFRWLAADASVAPKYTLDTVEAIVTHRDVNIEGMILTLKMSRWSQSEEIEQSLERVATWGYDSVDARQLSYNRQEWCLFARRTQPRDPMPLRDVSQYDNEIEQFEAEEARSVQAKTGQEKPSTVRPNPPSNRNPKVQRSFQSRPPKTNTPVVVQPPSGGRKPRDTDVNDMTPAPKPKAARRSGDLPRKVKPKHSIVPKPSDDGNPPTKRPPKA